LACEDLRKFSFCVPRSGCLLSRLARRKPSQTKKGRKGELVGFWILSFALPVPQILSSISRWLCWRRQKDRKREGGGVRVWNMLGFSSCSQSACVRACVRVYVFFLEDFAEIFSFDLHWVIENCREKKRRVIGFLERRDRQTDRQRCFREN